MATQCVVTCAETGARFGQLLQENIVLNQARSITGSMLDPALDASATGWDTTMLGRYAADES